MALNKLHALPILVFVLCLSTVVATYITAVLLGHIPPNFPYISDTGTFAPESCVFGQSINIVSVLLGGCVTVRYLQIKVHLETYPLHPRVSPLNKTSVWLGLLSAFGLSIVGNFQVRNVMQVHFCGAFLCFGLGTAYVLVQVAMTYYLQPLVNTLGVARLRMILGSMCAVLLLVTCITGIWSYWLFTGSDITQWFPGDGGYELHIVSTAGEWSIAICFCLFILSFSREFRNINIEMKVVIVERNRAGGDSETAPVIANSAADEVDVIVRQGGTSVIT